MKRLILLLIILLPRVVFAGGEVKAFLRLVPRSGITPAPGTVYYDGSDFRQVTPSGDIAVPGPFDPSSNQTITGTWSYTNTITAPKIDHATLGTIAAPKAYASVRLVGAAQLVTITTGGTYYPIAGSSWASSADPHGLVTADTAGVLTVTTAGTGQYLLNWNLGFDGSHAEAYSGRLYIDGSIPAPSIMQITNVIGQEQSMGITSVLNLSTTRTLTLRMTAVTSGATATVNHANFTAIRLEAN